MGQNRGVILWDVAGRRPEREKDNYRIVFLFRDSFGSVGTTEFRMLMDTTYSTFAPVKKDEQEKAKKDLEKQIPEGSGISVESDKRGLVLRLGEVFFDFDSYRLRDDAVKNLDTVGAILKSRYPDREIQVEGHTDIVGRATTTRRFPRTGPRSRPLPSGAHRQRQALLPRARLRPPDRRQQHRIRQAEKPAGRHHHQDELGGIPMRSGTGTPLSRPYAHLQ
jgi:hypothetical protein